MSHTTRTAAAAMALAASLSTPLSAHAADAMRVVRDPATGELRGPTAAEAAALQKADAAQRASSKGTKAPVEIRYPDGTVETKLDEDSMMYSVVALGPDGKLNFECLPNQQAKQFVKSAGKKTNSAVKAVAKVGHEHP